MALDRNPQNLTITTDKPDEPGKEQHIDNIWQLQAAKDKFSELDERTLVNGAQIVTRRGKKNVVVLSFAEYERLTKQTGSLVNFLMASPLPGSELALEREPRTRSNGTRNQSGKSTMMECIYEYDENGFLCDEHIEDHPHEDDDGPMPLVNSLHMGMCGYYGPAEPPY